MKSFVTSGALIALSLLGFANAKHFPGTGDAPVEIEERADAPAMVCNADNALRALRATQRAAVATPFCQQYISVPTSTATVTITPTTFVSSTAVVTETNVYTEFVLETNIVTLTIDATNTVTVTQTITVPHTFAKRTEVPVPSFMSQYPASRISSACSCLSVPPPSTTVTATADPITNYNVGTSTATLSVPTFVTIETSVTESTTVTVATVTETAQATVTASPTSFRLKAKGGPQDGRYLTPVVWYGDDRNLAFTSDITKATAFTLRSDGILSFQDSINHSPPIEVRSFLNTNYNNEQVFFSSIPAAGNCVQGGGCYWITFAVSVDNELVSTGPRGLTVQSTCSGPDGPGGVNQLWWLASPDVTQNTCSALTLGVEYVA
ncbi:hypothetical protein S7711_10856 [Stachybotrys chartarum IBT 7711]|uniref:Ricin B lectin domain-containing protein n=1 Tax=Stachybotrys chartarum (strain CBS 109288 / IBT 7711) TaxID=1280523 RepID=A0A084BAA5_STACB|nr:hypothetical protein S7711_10856 [Stachybotrys chartarum IBT 7711]